MASEDGGGRARFVSRHIGSEALRGHYEELCELGHGSFGRVALARERSTGQERVCKTVRTAGMRPDALRLARREIQLLCDLDHPHIVRLYEYAEDFARQELVMVLEYLRSGDCLDLVQDSLLPSESLVSRIISQTLSALGHCHARNIVHRDVKLENLMLGSSPHGGQPDCKLIDFGFAARCTGPLPEVLGTPGYMAPEVSRGEGYTSAADVWSLGVCAIELLAGVCPFGRIEDDGGQVKPILARVASYREFDDLRGTLEGSLGSGWPGRSNAAKDLARRLLFADRRARLPAKEALRHPWCRQQSGLEAGLSGDILQSLADFLSAPPAVRACLCAIAARTSIPDTKYLGGIFLEMDADGDGQLSRAELHQAVDSIGDKWGPKINASDLFDAMDMDRSGFVSFTKFMAACIHGSFCSQEDLLISAFEALDESRGGILSAGDVSRMLSGCSSQVLEYLPQDHQFGVDDWVGCLLKSCRPIAESSRPPRPNIRSSFFDRFFCLGCYADAEDTELCVARGGANHLPLTRVEL